MKKKLAGNTAVKYILIVVLAVIQAFVFTIFIIPSNFAPSGVSGIATMIQYLFHIDIGYVSLIYNIPMLVVSYFLLRKRYVFRTLAFILPFSLTNILLQSADLSAVSFAPTDVGGYMLGAIAGGVLLGLIYGVLVRLGGSTGGIDILAAFINRKHPEFDTIWIGFAINILIALISFFVYGMSYQPVILCIIYTFVSTRVSDAILKGARSAARFEVYTNQPEELSEELMSTLHHGCTVINAKGMYSHEDRSILICVINRRQVVDFVSIIEKYDDTFAIVSNVNDTYGSFSKVK